MSTSKSKTKGKEVLEAILGQPVPGFGIGNPTEADVACFYMWLKDDSKAAKRAYNTSEEKESLCTKVADTIMVHWRENNPEVILMTRRSVRRKVQYLINKRVLPLMHKTSLLEKKNETKLLDQVQKFLNTFDIESQTVRQTTASPDKENEPSKAKRKKEDPDYIPNEAADEIEGQRQRNRFDYPQFIEIGLRYGLSNNVLSNLLNSLLVDMGIEDPSLFVSPGKVGLMKYKHERHLRAMHKLKTGYKFLGFDGKKSSIKVEKNQTEVVDKQTIICQAARMFVAHFCPQKGKGINVATGIYETLKKTDSEDTVLSISADGCFANTGVSNGAIRNLEVMVGRPLQWFICLLHLVELVFRDTFIAIDGNLKSPNDYIGPIGEQISGDEGLVQTKMVNFEPIKGMVPDIYADYCNNNDVQMLHRKCLLVQQGPGADKYLKISDAKPGKVNSSRWVTTATNILCLYIQTEDPSDNLILLVKYVLRVYAPIIFQIKCDWQFYYGAQHYFNLLKYSRDLFQEEEDRPELLEVTLKVLTTNSYSIHPENMILRMLYDDNPEVQEKALKIIQQQRNKKKNLNFRKFLKPKLINFEATSYLELIDWNNYKPRMLTSPPILSEYSIQDIKTKNFGKDLLMVPCHSQHVERFVYLTSLAGQNVVGHDKREAYILNKVESTSKIPTSASKQVWKEVSAEKVKRNLFPDSE